MSQKLQSLPVDEYLRNPSLRNISAFFLGGVFLLSLHYIISSPTVQYVTRAIKRAFKLNIYMPASQEALEEHAEEKARVRRWVEETLLGPAENSDPKNLVLILSIFALSASLSMFGSTLMFKKGQNVACSKSAVLDAVPYAYLRSQAFVIAWSGLSSEMIRIIGFIRLTLDLRALGMKQWEMILNWLYVLGVIVIMFVNNALAPGILRSIVSMPSIALCSRQLLLSTALLSAVFNVIFEVYAIIRFATFLAPSFLHFQHRWNAIQDIRIGKALSLLLLDLLTLVPFVTPINIAAECIPWAIATAIVLAAFNQEHEIVTTALSRVDSIPSTRMMNIYRDNRESIAPGSPPFSQYSATPTRSGTRRSRMTQVQQPYAPFSLARLEEERDASRQGSGVDGTVLFDAAVSNKEPGSAPPVMVQRSVRPWPALPIVNEETTERPTMTLRDFRRHMNLVELKSRSEEAISPANVTSPPATPGRKSQFANAQSSRESIVSPITARRSRRVRQRSARMYDPSREMGTDPAGGYVTIPSEPQIPRTAGSQKSAGWPQAEPEPEPGSSGPYWYMIRGGPQSGGPLSTGSLKPKPTAVSQTMLDAMSGKGSVEAVSTGIAEPMSSTRVRFGARPMRSASGHEPSTRGSVSRRAAEGVNPAGQSPAGAKSARKVE
ncbi:hypothetical protein FRC17_009333 [Serendipita sp. 399]|nr:hypothetical protein FRC17_009333 [Serendipita sp. 399]